MPEQWRRAHLCDFFARILETVKFSGRLTGRTAVIRALGGLVVVLAVLLGAYLIPLPSVGRLRDWADSFGPNACAVTLPIRIASLRQRKPRA